MSTLTDEFLRELQKESMHSALKGALIGAPAFGAFSAALAPKAKDGKRHRVRQGIAGGVAGGLLGAELGYIRHLTKTDPRPASIDEVIDTKRRIGAKLKGPRKLQYEGEAKTLENLKSTRSDYDSLHKMPPVRDVHENPAPERTPPRKGHLSLVKQNGVSLKSPAAIGALLGGAVGGARGISKEVNLRRNEEGNKPAEELSGTRKHRRKYILGNALAGALGGGALGHGGALGMKALRQEGLKGLADAATEVKGVSTHIRKDVQEGAQGLGRRVLQRTTPAGGEYHKPSIFKRIFNRKKR
jgi:hypothetical protein